MSRIIYIQAGPHIIYHDRRKSGSENFFFCFFSLLQFVHPLPAKAFNKISNAFSVRQNNGQCAISAITLGDRCRRKPVRCGDAAPPPARRPAGAERGTGAKDCAAREGGCRGGRGLDPRNVYCVSMALDYKDPLVAKECEAPAAPTAQPPSHSKAAPVAATQMRPYKASTLRM